MSSPKLSFQELLLVTQGAQDGSRVRVAKATLETDEHLAMLAWQVPGEINLCRDASGIGQIVSPPVGAKAGNLSAHIESVQATSDEFDARNSLRTSQMVQLAPAHQRPCHGFGISETVGLPLGEYMPDNDQ